MHQQVRGSPEDRQSATQCRHAICTSLDWPKISQQSEQGEDACLMAQVPGQVALYLVSADEAVTSQLMQCSCCQPLLGCPLLHRMRHQ